jgi:phospholipase D-like protein
MIRFLSGDDIVTEIKKCLGDADAKTADFAVGYWGEGAIERLDLGKIDVPVRLLCDLRSLNCNPYELEKLLRPGVELKTRDGLHAKVYLTANAVITGSANASINGLGHEEDESDLKLEAAVACSEEKVIICATKWFQTHWDESDTVDKNSLEAIKPAWKWRRKTRSLELLPLLVRAPELFQEMPISLTIFRGSDDLKYAEVREKLYTNEQREKYGDTYPFYVDHSSNWSIKPGHYVVNYWAEWPEPKTGSWKFLRDGRFYEGGLWCVRSLDRIKLENERTLKIVDASPDMKSSVPSFKFSREDHKTLGSCVEQYFQKEREAQKHVRKNMLEMRLSELPEEILAHLRRKLARKKVVDQ